MPTKFKGGVKAKRALNAYICMSRAFDSINSRMNTEFHQGITASQFSLMESLYHLGPMTPSELAKKMLMSGGNITFVINNLVKRGWIDRKQSSKDRRSSLIRLKREGAKRVEEYLPSYVENITSAMQSLTISEQKHLHQLCKKLGLGTEKH